eukprot:jgi/Chrzof1/4245/Cz14g04190.t1
MALTRTAKRRLQQGPAPGTDSKRPRLQSVELTDSDDDDVESRDAINEEMQCALLWAKYMNPIYLRCGN